MSSTDCCGLMHSDKPCPLIIWKGCRTPEKIILRWNDKIVVEGKQFITTEPTRIHTRDGRTYNGNLRYTIRPIEDDLALLHELLEQSTYLFLQRWTSSHAQTQALLFHPSNRCLTFRLFEFFLSTIIDKIICSCTHVIREPVTSPTRELSTCGVPSPATCSAMSNTNYSKWKHSSATC